LAVLLNSRQCERKEWVVCRENVENRKGAKEPVQGKNNEAEAYRGERKEGERREDEEYRAGKKNVNVTGKDLGRQHSGSKMCVVLQQRRHVRIMDSRK